MKPRLGMALLIAAGVGLLVTIGLMVLRGKPAPPEDWEREKQRPDITRPANAGEEPAGPISVSGTELTVEEGGKVIWRASFGGQIELDQEGRTARAEQVNWQFEGEGFEGLTVEAPIMTADYDLRQLRFAEGVVISAEEGDLLFSAGEVRYQFDTHKLIATDDVRFRRGSYSGQVEELVIDNNTKIIRLKRGCLQRSG